MSTTTTYPEITIWLWPSGLFPRRIIYLLAAKKITTSILREHNITLIPVLMQMDPMGLFSKRGNEERPAGTSLPIMRIRPSNPSPENDNKNEEFWIRESPAIMEYLSDLFSPEKGYPDLRGSNVYQRARSRDIVSCFTDAVIFSLVHLVHTNKSTTMWSGLSEEDMSAAAGAHGHGKFETMMKRLEMWVEEDVGVHKTKSLAGKGGDVTFADIALMAQVEYLREMYGTVWVEDFPVLKGWWEGTRGEGWVVPREKLSEVEKTGDWSALFG